jgi:hypothetical protein
MTESKRYYAFDSLRASMMFLGIVIHSAMSYSSSIDRSWPLRAKETSDVFFMIVEFIHAFRMPVFFLVAGFFGAFLFYNKSPKAMIKNRFKRIFLPFVVFLIFLYPLLTFALKYCKAIFNDDIPISIEQHFTSPFSYIPLILFHLWFLYFLFIISLIMYLFFKWIKIKPINIVDRIFEQTFRNPLYRLLVLSILSFLVLFLFSNESFQTSIGWFPNLGVLMYFIVFYLTGWFLFRKKELINTLKNFDVVITVIGIVLFFLKFYFGEKMSLINLQIINSLITSFLSLGIIGLFLSFADINKGYITYFVNSAYWVYLIHFLITILLAGLINDLPISIFLKFIIVLFVTTCFCLLSYHIFARKTFIASFLNGKRG